MKFKIGEGTLSDYHKVKEIWRAGGLHTTLDISELFRKFIKKRYMLITAEIDGRIVGAVEAFHRWLIGYIHRLAVDPKHQGYGIGSALLMEICERLKAKKARFVILGINPRSDRREDLVKFYRRNRFRAIGIIFIKRL